MGGALHEANSATLRRALVEYIAAKPAVSTDRLYAAFAALPELEVADEMSDMEAAGIIHWATVWSCTSPRPACSAAAAARQARNSDVSLPDQRCCGE